MSKVYMMVTITNRNKRKDFRTFFKEHGLPVVISCNRYRRDVEKAAPGTDHEDADRCTRDGGIIHCSA